MNQKALMQKCFILLTVLSLTLTGCSPEVKIPQPPTAPATLEAPGAMAKDYLAEMVPIGPRIAGTAAEVKAADWITAELESMGYTVTREEFTFEENSEVKNSQNIIAVKKGTTPGQVIIGAHYDSKDIGAGVDDNGSGVAVMLEAAKVLKDTETPQTLKFVFFGAEEVDLNGSIWHANHLPAEELKNTLLMVNFDSLVAGDVSNVYGNGDDKGKYRDRVLEIAKTAQLDLTTQGGDNPEYPAGTTGDWSDHAPFKEKGLPVIYFESTNWSLGEKDGYTQVDTQYGVNGEIWHTEFDTLEYIEKTFPGRIDAKLKTFSQAIQMLLKEDISGI